jgi:hypothetical protein
MFLLEKEELVFFFSDVYHVLFDVGLSAGLDHFLQSFYLAFLGLELLFERGNKVGLWLLFDVLLVLEGLDLDLQTFEFSVEFAILMQKFLLVFLFDLVFDVGLEFAH